jgi:hypothetical protein
MSNSKVLCVALGLAVLALGDVHAAQTFPRASATGTRATSTSVSKLKSVSARKTKVVHSPYARAAGAHATAPTPGNPIKGHSVNMVQGQGISSQRHHAVGRPHP